MHVISAHFQRCPTPQIPRSIKASFTIAPDKQQEAEDFIIAVYDQFHEQLRYAQYLIS